MKTSVIHTASHPQQTPHLMLSNAYETICSIAQRVLEWIQTLFANLILAPYHFIANWAGFEKTISPPSPQSKVVDPTNPHLAQTSIDSKKALGTIATLMTVSYFINLFGRNASTISLDSTSNVVENSHSVLPIAYLASPYAWGGIAITLVVAGYIFHCTRRDELEEIFGPHESSTPQPLPNDHQTRWWGTIPRDLTLKLGYVAEQVSSLWRRSLGDDWWEKASATVSSLRGFFGKKDKERPSVLKTFIRGSTSSDEGPLLTPAEPLRTSDDENGTDTHVVGSDRDSD